MHATSAGNGPSLDSESAMEMSLLETLEVTPQHVGDEIGSDDDDDDSDGDDDGRMVLLSPREIKPAEIGVWSQAKDIAVECAPTLLFTTFGLLFTGELYDHVSQWRAMKQIDQLIIIIPVILNLMGNLEMNLSARLGTAANMGHLDKPHRIRSLILGNLSLLQLQAAVVSFVAACVSFLVGLMLPSSAGSREGPISPSSGNVTMLASRQSITTFSYNPRRPIPTFPSDGIRHAGPREFIMVVSCAMSAACLSSLFLGSFMCFLIIICRRWNRDPDNIAPPVAACLGDLFTLSLLGGVSTVLINLLATPLPLLIVILIIISSTACGVFTSLNPNVRPLMTQGWAPLFGAMMISCGTGIVLDTFVGRYQDFALFAAIITGLPGGVGSILVSRLSTALHASALSLLPSQSTSSFFPSSKQDPGVHTVMATLVLVSLPIVMILLSALRLLGWLHLPFVFIVFYLVCFCATVTASLFLARWLANLLWSKNCDPDIYAMPLHSAMMDLVGQGLLVLCFEIASLTGATVRTKSGIIR